MTEEECRQRRDELSRRLAEKIDTMNDDDATVMLRTLNDIDFRLGELLAERQQKNATDTEWSGP